ncbi:PKD domain-containing protein [Rufibacter hautae]|uniref:PKD domain-containing protein n=1 Tax=Rufibacter hautae TaxID=2595005 RepID=A0A5B6TDI0_9BACT|nr:hypothetical protein [Rufibacter hautae]KAA3437001.1 hypothetical protein FOA19_21750 [Rufibacter hautae]
MKLRFKVAFTGLLVALWFISSCQDDDSDAEPEVIVVANAGPDQIIALPQNSLVLDGSQSTAINGNIKSYHWSKASGPASFHLKDSLAAQTLVENLTVGSYEFKLKVTAENGLTESDIVLVTVEQHGTGDWDYWAYMGNLSQEEFFLGSGNLFGGTNFLMGIEDQVFAVSKMGNIWKMTAARTWQNIGKFPELLQKTPLVFSIGDKGYCLGNGHLWQYDGRQNQWQRRKDVPEPILDAQIALVIQDKVYLVSSTAGKVMRYDPATDAYSPLNDYPGTGAATGFVVNRKGYCVEEEGTCWELDPATGNWRQRASVPHALTRISSFSLNEYGYVIYDLGNAAYNHNEPMQVTRYDPLEDVWTEFEEDFPGFGVNELKTISLENRAIIGLGYNNGDVNATDLWQFD